MYKKCHISYEIWEKLFSKSHLFSFFKTCTCHRNIKEKICVITTQLLDDKIRQNTQTYTKCIFLHEEVEFCLACFAQYRKMKDSREENK